MLIILFSLKNSATGQLFTQSLPLWEPLEINPAYAGAADCRRANIQYLKQINYEYATFSYLHHFEGTGISIAFPVKNKLEGKSINIFSGGFIFSKALSISHLNKLIFAIDSRFLQQSIRTDRLVFRHQIDPLSGEITPPAYGYVFESLSRPDFSAGILWLSPKMRSGLAWQNISQFYLPREELKLSQTLTFHIGRSFKTGINKKNPPKLLIPEVFIQYTQKQLRFAYGVSAYSGVFSSQIVLKHSPANSAFWAASGFRIRHGNFLYGYAYELMVLKYPAHSLSTHSISIAYKYRCNSKRNKKNTIFCTSF